MVLLLEVIFVLVGLFLMLLGADLLVSKAEKFGRIHHWSQVFIGVAVVAVGTSLPELVVSVLAALKGHPLLAVGNIVGSNVANIGLIAGLSAILGGIALKKKTVDYDIPLSIIPIGVLVFGYILRSTLTASAGVLLIVAYLFYLAITEHEYIPHTGNGTTKLRFSGLDTLLMLVAPVLLFGGGELTLRYSEKLLTRAGIPEIVMGGVFLAIGTSLPELFASAIAVLRKNGQIAIGNVLGSNVFNMLVALGITVIIAPVDVSKLFWEVVMLGLMSGLFLLMAKTGKKYSISRNEGLVLLSGYIVYILVLLFVVT